MIIWGLKQQLLIPRSNMISVGSSGDIDSDET